MCVHQRANYRQLGSPTRAQLCGLQQTIQFTRERPRLGTHIHAMPVHRILLVGYSDASFNKRKSQLGLLVVAAHQDVLKPGVEVDVNLIDGRSYRSRCVTRGTLSIALHSTIDYIRCLSALRGIAEASQAIAPGLYVPTSILCMTPQRRREYSSTSVL
eukprot:3880955-Amphidinium_carterae.1